MESMQQTDDPEPRDGGMGPGAEPGAGTAAEAGAGTAVESGAGTAAEAGAGDGAGQPNFVAFRVSGQDYCVDILAVREISQRTHITPLPQSPGFVSGVINLRGSVVPVLDCRIRFGLPRGQGNARQVIIVVQVGERTVGLLVDEVTEILNIGHDAIKPVPDGEPDSAAADGSPPASGPLVSGIIVRDTRIIRHINLTRVVPEKELAAA